ncbi:hypothetical protein DP73_21480 [Desulfosporosinus sp. HMP52]|uniref:4Fe-4S dicluster domain-containing protein n=1 Tax=Desulfosporosinus sp. HMP52 TaxID=1487923 RepID=UPI00051FE6B7|nr:4Fe-4S dicluster domain-containing protein [Desulfosporosinus sp. HMP52]KGK81249.1 hypothetical protein DP73_21480 [Desulfosporosinus sp. HMP52]
MTMVITGNSKLQSEVEDLCDVNIDACIQCGTCTGGCSGIELMEYGPRQIIQLIKLNQRKILLESRAIWMCVSCHICEDRCPAKIKITSLMDTLREMACKDSKTKSNAQIQFHKLYIKQVKSFGRSHESMLTVALSMKGTPLPPLRLMKDLITRMRVDIKPPHRPDKSYRLAIKRLEKGGSIGHGN